MKFLIQSILFFMVVSNVHADEVNTILACDGTVSADGGLKVPDDRKAMDSDVYPYSDSLTYVIKKGKLVSDGIRSSVGIFPSEIFSLCEASETEYIYSTNCRMVNPHPFIIDWMNAEDVAGVKELKQIMVKKYGVSSDYVSGAQSVWGQV